MFRTFLLLLLTLSALACTDKEPVKSTYFDRTISPILTTSCVRSNTGASCHVTTPKGNALGNLDLSSYEGLNRRRDLLQDYGPYSQSAFLIKSVAPFQVDVQSYSGKRTTITTDIRHTGGTILDPTASGYQVLRRWIQNGASENNGGPPPRTLERSECTTEVPSEAGFNPNADPGNKDFQTFKDEVNPVLQKSCVAGNCHGTSANELFLTCGKTDAEVRWNYHAAREYLAQNVDQSELLRRPLAPLQGGSFHEGGTLFETTDDDGYVAIRRWAIEHGPFAAPVADPSFAFFADRVQPILVKKGCTMLQCHSAAMFHDYRLRGGSGGAFSYSATRKNYQLSLAQMSLETEDVQGSRLVRKNLLRAEFAPGGQGIAHRGGPLLEDFGDKRATPEVCEQATPAYDYDNGDLDKIPAYCIIREWHKRERAARGLTALTAIAYVQRSGGPGRVQDFDVYRPGADLHLARVTAAPVTGALSLSDDRSVLASCGLDRATADVRRPMASWSGQKLAFAARSRADEPLSIYEINADGTGCVKNAAINAVSGSQNGLLVHNFDPAYSPPDVDGKERMVFASTRGNLDRGIADHAGPQRTAADPTKPNANLYVLEPDGRVRQLTYLLNVERQPSFMSDGRVVFVTEKRAPGFYQLALRRVNLDGGDYHPLYAQRGTIGYAEASSVVELSDHDFAAVFADPGLDGTGQLGVINRSIGVDFQSTKPEDYVVDPGVLDPAQPQSPDPGFFLRSLRFPDAAAQGRPGVGSGVYATPASLPGNRMLVSYAAGDGKGGDFDVYVFDKDTGARTRLVGDVGSAEVEAIALYPRFGRGVYKSSFDEPNGHVRVFENKTEAHVHVLNVPLLASLLFQNTPTGRLLEEGVKEFEVLEDMPPPLEVTSLDGAGPNAVSDAFGKVYVRRRSLGKVAIEKDGSSHFVVPGGLPILYRFPETEFSKARNLPRTQRESSSFAPGEYSHQVFRPEFFNGLCGHCHGAISGKQVDVSVQPDMLSQASRVIARTKEGDNLNKPPNARGAIERP